MKICIDLGKEAMENGNPPVGAIVIKDSKIIGKGLEAGKSKKDITRHAEIEAIKDALRNNQSTNLKDCVLYTTHEPCIMCSYVLRHHQLGAIIYGVGVEHIGGYTSEFKVLETENVSKWGRAPIIISGILEAQCQALSKAYTHKISSDGNQ